MLNMTRTTRMTRNFGPEGQASSFRPQAELKYAVAASLSHGFARMAEPGQQGSEERHFHNEDGYDEGLVHAHGWAREE